MTPYYAPFPDELLTSWLARQSYRAGGRVLPGPVAVRNRSGVWRHPDIQPARAWLKGIARQFGGPVSELAAITLARRAPKLPLDFLAWDRAPFPAEVHGLRPRPRLLVSWCSQCLAEDFCSGRPAYVRQHWVLAASAFCHKHKWPLEERCNGCGSISWRFAAAAQGPLRMICNECWRPLERAFPEALSAGKQAAACWAHVIAFEEEVAAAVQGKTPDQFLLNFTSAEQLLNELRDICRLLTSSHRGDARSDVPLNAITCPAMTLGRMQHDFPASDAPFPLAAARLPLRRCLLAAAAAIIVPHCEAGYALFGQDGHAAIETFTALADGDALDHCLSGGDRWSPTFAARVEEFRHKRARKSGSHRPRARRRSPVRPFGFASPAFRDTLTGYGA